MVPEGATLLPNPISRAPGFQIGNVFVLPGVPSIMQGIFEQLKLRLAGVRKCSAAASAATSPKVHWQRIWGHCRRVIPNSKSAPIHIFGAANFGVTLVLRGTDNVHLADATEDLMALIRALGATRKRVERVLASRAPGKFGGFALFPRLRGCKVSA